MEKRILAIMMAMGLSFSAQALNRNWIGNTDANFGTAANWSATPVNNNTPVFGAAGTSGTTLNNDITGLILKGITFDALGDGFTINGNAITLTGNISQVNTNSYNDQVINLAMTMAVTRAVNVRGGTITLGGNIDGAGGLTIGAFAGKTVLSGNNSFNGDITVGNTATLEVSSDSNLGNASDISVGQNARLKATESFATSKAITLNLASSGIQVDSGKTLTLNGVLTGTGASPVITGGGAVTLNNSGNTFAAGSVLLVNNSSTLNLGNAAALNGTTLKYNGGYGLDNTSGSAMSPTGLNGLQMTSGFRFLGTDDLDLSGAEAGFVQTADASRTINVVSNTLMIAGIGSTGAFVDSTTAKVDGSLVKAGDGTLVITSASDYTLGTTVAAGTLRLGASGTLGSGSVGVNSGATLDVSATGGLVITAGKGIGGGGAVTGNLTLDLGAFLAFDTNFTLSVSGTVALDNTFGVASLVQTDGNVIDWTQVDNNTYTLISNGSDFSNIQNWGVANAADIGGGRSAYFEAGSLNLVVIPEPATLGLVVALGGGLLWIRRVFMV